MIPDRASAAEDLDARQVLRFWFGEPAEYGRRRKAWFEKDAAFDADVRANFATLLGEIAAGARPGWVTRAPECLARILVLDQFSRHIYRGSPRAFAADPVALATARHAVSRGYDNAMLPVERLFVYLPFEHSEALEDQVHACELTAPLAAFPETADAPRYALAHREIIERFGRFPHRNAVLGRESTEAERAFLLQPGSTF
jgi:uncharacterized protein (DUF924 family)